MGMPPPKGLRDEFAIAALGALISNAKGLPRVDDKDVPKPEYVAAAAYAVADAMMEQRLL